MNKEKKEKREAQISQVGTLIKGGYSERKAASEVGINYWTFRYYQKKKTKVLPRCALCNIEKKDFIGNFCKSCGNRNRKLSQNTKDKISNNKLRAKKISETWKKKFISGEATRTGASNPLWKGGKARDRIYVKLYRPDHPQARKNYVFEHRLIVEQKIRRYLRPEEVIHHINEIKDDNRIENLMIFPNQKEHAKWHNKLKRYGYLTNPMKRKIAERWD